MRHQSNEGKSCNTVDPPPIPPLRVSGLRATVAITGVVTVIEEYNVVVSALKCSTCFVSCCVPDASGTQQAIIMMIAMHEM